MDSQLKVSIDSLLKSENKENQEVGLRLLLNPSITQEDAYYLLAEFLEKDHDESLRGAIQELLIKLIPSIKKNRVNEL